MMLLYHITLLFVPLINTVTCFSIQNRVGHATSKRISNNGFYFSTAPSDLETPTLTAETATDDYTTEQINDVVSSSSDDDSNASSKKSKIKVPMSNKDLLAASPKFPRTWVPLASTYELDPDRPTPVKFLGQKYVVYRDNKDQWVAMDDACPHRLAPLSEGRIDREKDQIQCSYHGWSFNSSGACESIPQANEKVASKFSSNTRACAVSYPVVEHKNILWTWPWKEDPLSVLVGGDGEDKRRVLPEQIMEGVFADATTFTRDLPYGWDTLVENIVDPSHIPFAHHGMQGTRDDAIPINMTIPISDGENGFHYHWQDRTMKMLRSGIGEFRAPYLVKYDANYTSETPRPPFRLSVMCIPTAPGWSRAIIFTGGTSEVEQKEEETKNEIETSEKTSTKEKKKSSSLVGKIFKAIPPWAMHILSNRFLDTDLAFLHYQEQRQETMGDYYNSNDDGVNNVNNMQKQSDNYFIPAKADRSIAYLHRWVSKYAHSMRPLPPAIESRPILFDRYAQHTAHCKHCQAALKGMKKWRRRAYLALTLSMLTITKHWTARITTLACFGFLRILYKLEKAMKEGEFKHYENH